MQAARCNPTLESDSPNNSLGALRRERDATPSAIDTGKILQGLYMNALMERFI